MVLINTYSKILGGAYLAAAAIGLRVALGPSPGLSQIAVGLFITAMIPVGILITAILVFGYTMKFWSEAVWPEHPVDMTAFIEFHDPELREKYSKTAMPMWLAYESYLSGKIGFKYDLYTVLKDHREELFRMNLDYYHLWFLIGKLLPDAFNHSTRMDHGEVAPVYNRGNDFYQWFLGPSMVYTSAVFNDSEESLEVAQDRKLGLICQKLHLKEGESLLDIGCGWGSLAIHAAKNFGAKVTGVSIAEEQIKFGMDRAAKEGVPEKVNLLVKDYREVAGQKFDKISCVEMAEHVGVWKFQDFCKLVKNCLKDDGLFYLQIAGLRRAWQFEDLVWGVFMGTYIFPAADASCPLTFSVNHLETAGFEIRSVETVGIHYSLTIKKWYDNWLSNREQIVAKYGNWWFRLWSIFLGWSVIIAGQGSSTCYQIVAHKNLNDYRRRKFVGVRP